MIERRESGSPVGLLSTGISKNCAARKKAAPRGSCIVRDLYFSNATFFFLSLSLSLSRHTIRSPRDFLVKTRQTWTKKHENLSLDSSRVFVSPLEEFRAKDAFSLFSRQPRINERGCIFNKSASNYSTNFSRDSDNASSLGSVRKFSSPLK